MPLGYLAESIGFEPMQRFHVDGLAIRCITTLPTLQNWWTGGAPNSFPDFAGLLRSLLGLSGPLIGASGESRTPKTWFLRPVRMPIPSPRQKVLRLCVSVSVDTQGGAFRFPSTINDLLLTSVMILLHCRTYSTVPQFGTP